MSGPGAVTRLCDAAERFRVRSKLTNQKEDGTMKRISASRSWVIPAILGILAAILQILNVELILPEKVHSLYFRRSQQP